MSNHKDLKNKVFCLGQSFHQQIATLSFLVTFKNILTLFHENKTTNFSIKFFVKKQSKVKVNIFHELCTLKLFYGNFVRMQR